MQFESHIFEVDENTKILHERINLIYWIALLLIILFIIIEWLWMAIILTLVILASSTITMITRWGTIEPLNGNFTKELTITSDEIIDGEICYPVSELRIRRITTDDYLGLSKMSHLFFARYLVKSNGTSNHLWFVHKGEDFKFRFRIQGKSELTLLEEIKKGLRMKW